MKAIMVMFDSLNRRLLPPYGCDWVHAPNFQRLAENSVTFRNCYVGSLPCMPARRELHTGRHNFLHRSWGPMEPFDNSMPEILKKKGVHTHLATDHYHYFEDGGATYHTKYKTWEGFRGQEGDHWIGEVEDPSIPEHVGNRDGENWRQDWINRKYIQKPEDFPQAKTFAAGMEFMKQNHDQDSWFLQIETFDPHEPFYSHSQYKELYQHNYNGPHFDWPGGPVREMPEQVQHGRYEYAALVSMCDDYLGKILDLMDELELWKDTMLIVNTDHGYMLGEHDWWGKVKQPFYNEYAHIPLFIWDPRSKKQGEYRDALVQTIDIAPTLLDLFGVDIPKDVSGKPLKNTVATDQKVRDVALYGVHGGHVNCTDGRYVYMRAPVHKQNSPLFNYTLMPTHMRGYFDDNELGGMELSEPLPFTKGFKTLKTPDRKGENVHQYGTLLFDLEHDPEQMHPLEDEAVETHMIQLLVQAMKEHDAPAEQYERLGL